MLTINKYHMKTRLILSVILIIMISCQREANKNIQNCSVSKDDSIRIVKEITKTSDEWAEANSNKNADKAIEFWDSSPNMKYAENGEFFENKDSIHSVIKNYYKQTKSLDVEWLHRTVMPLTTNLAAMSGSFHFKLQFMHDEILEDTTSFTGLFIKNNNNWSLLQGHESFK
jgi:hypothetical protein